VGPAESARVDGIGAPRGIIQRDAHTLLTQLLEVGSSGVIDGIKILREIGLPAMLCHELLPRRGGCELGGQFSN
jgi:hypothetical protein